MLEQRIETRFAEELRAFQRNRLGEQTPELSLHEKVLVYSNTKFLWEGLNDALREGQEHPVEAFLNEALGKLPNHARQVFKGADLSELQKAFFQKAALTEGKFLEPAFFSTSLSKNIAHQFSRGNTLFEVMSKTGKLIEDLSFYGSHSPENEKEVLFRSKTPFLVLDFERIGSKTIIYLEEIAR